MNNLIKSLLINLDWILFSFIINMNLVRFFLKINQSNIITFLLFFFLFCFFVGKNTDNSKNRIKINIYEVIVFALCFYSMFSSPINGFLSVIIFIKLLIGIILSIMAYSFNIEKLNKCLSMIVYINVFYALFIVLFQNYSFNYIYFKSNYLESTITLSLTLSILLGRFINSFKQKFKLKICLFYLLEIIICLYAILLFPGRANVIFPLYVIFFIFFLISLFNIKYFYKCFPLICFLVLIGLVMYLNLSSDYTIKRMIRLFEYTSSERRIPIFQKYTKWVLDNNLYILGGGTNSSRVLLGYYPHNIYLQLIGEFGIIGIAFAIFFTIIVFITIFKIAYNTFRKRKYNYNFEIAFCSVISGFIYYWLTFNKSFSMYDSYPMMIFAAFVLCLNKPKNKYFALKFNKDLIAKYKNEKCHYRRIK